MVDKIKLPSPSEIKDRYDIDPLKEIFYKLKEKNDMYFALALRKNITAEFFEFLKRQYDRNEQVNLNISGRTRSSKSTDAGVIAKFSCNYISRVLKIDKPFNPERIFIFNTSQFLNVFNEDTAKFHDFYVIDEKRTYEAIQSGAMYEEGQVQDIDRIAAKLCIHRINIVGSYDDISNNAFYSLVTYGKNYKTFVNKLIVYTREENERVPLGYIEIPVTTWLCQRIQTRKTTDCITCPLYSLANHKQFGSKEKFKKCMLDKAKYERAKDENIITVTRGGIEERTKVKIDLAMSYFRDAVFMSLKNKSLKKVYIQDTYHEFTNRRLTIQEIEETVDRVEMIKTMSTKKESSSTPNKLTHYIK